MTATLTLLAVGFGLLLALEVLNALFDSVYEGLAHDAARKEPTPIYLLPPLLLRFVLASIVRVGRTVSLWVHELSHAAGQLVFGGRPRVVLLKNGGYAQARPWLDNRPARLVFVVGNNLGQGVICMAPIIVGSILLLAMLIGLTSIGVRDLPTFELIDLAHARAAAGATWHALAEARWWIWPIIVVVSLLLAPQMTPSSVDYVYGRAHLLAYALATLACSSIATHAPAALWVVAPIAGAAGVGATLFLPAWARGFTGGLLLATSVLALALAVLGWRTGQSPLAILHSMLGLVTYGFGIAAIVFATFVVGFLALSLISIRPRTLWYTLRAVPHHLLELVRRFHTCDKCGVHYRGKCDTCGRTPDAPAS